jgi:hypothetical protein
VVYTAPPGFSGVDEFNYTICNVAGKCSSSIVNVTVLSQLAVNLPPQLADDFFQRTATDLAPIALEVLDNDMDPDGDLDASTLAVLFGPMQGTVSRIDPVRGSLWYTPTTKNQLPDSDIIVYQVCDFCWTVQ